MEASIKSARSKPYGKGFEERKQGDQPDPMDDDVEPVPQKTIPPTSILTPPQVRQLCRLEESLSLLGILNLWTWGT